MTATTAARATVKQDGGALPTVLSWPVYTGTTIYQGTIVCVDTSHGYAVAPSTSTALLVLGIAKETIVNSGASGAKTVEALPCVAKFNNSAAGDAIAQADCGASCYLVDNQTVAKTSGGSTRSRAGVVVGVDSDGVWVVLGPYPVPGATYVTINDGQTLTNKRFVRRVGTDITATGTVQVADGEIFEVIPGSGTSITLGTTGVAEGDRFLFVKPGTENYAVAVGSLLTIPAGYTGYVEAIYLHGAWQLGDYMIRAAGKPLAIQGAPIAFTDGDVTVSVANGEEFDIPTTATNSTVTLSTVGAVRGSRLRFRADGTVNGHTVTYRIGVTSITAAATASKRHLCDASFDGTTWVAALSVGP